MRVKIDGEVVLGGGKGGMWIHVTRPKFVEINVPTFGYLRTEFLR